MTTDSDQERILICGSRRWPWPAAVDGVLDRLAARHGTRLVVIEGCSTGADRAAHLWCERHDLGEGRHRCHPVDWRAAKRTRPHDWQMAGPERNTRMLLLDKPERIIAFHDHFAGATGGTSDMALRGLLRDVPVWLVPGNDLRVGRWLKLDQFPRTRIDRVRKELDEWPRRPAEGAQATAGAAATSH